MALVNVEHVHKISTHKREERNMGHYQMESANGTQREGHPGLPFAGHPVNDQESILDFYFAHPTSSNTERPLGPHTSAHSDR